MSKQKRVPGVTHMLASDGTNLCGSKRFRGPSASNTWAYVNCMQCLDKMRDAPIHLSRKDDRAITLCGMRGIHVSFMTDSFADTSCGDCEEAALGHAEDKSAVPPIPREDVNQLHAEIARQSKRAAKFQEENLHLRERYEATHIRLIDCTVERNASRGLCQHLELTLKNELRARVEQGARRAICDENYALIRELLHDDKAAGDIDMKAYADRYPKATIGGLASICYEKGLKIDFKFEPKE